MRDNYLEIQNSLVKVWNENIFKWHSNTYLQPIIPIISDFLIQRKTKGSLLDFGCGFGRVANVFDKLGFEVTGIDSSQERITKAKLDYPDINFQQYEFTDTLPFDDNSFDVIFSNSVLQYVDHENFLNECDRVLNKDGCVIFIENLKNNPVTRLGRFALKSGKHKYQSYPWNHFTLNELTSLKEKFNYSKLEVFHLISPLAYFKPLRRMYSIFYRIDKFFLKNTSFKQLGWLGVFIGEKK